MNDEKDSKGQLALPIQYFRELDRNFHKGGRSFYFFDLDDNVLHLPTPIVLFSKKTGKAKEVSTADFAVIKDEVGIKTSPWFEYEIRFQGEEHSFMYFRDRAIDPKKEEQSLILDLRKAMSQAHIDWKGPSWNFFAYAVENSRPLAIITARGHQPNTLKRAINHLVQTRDLLTHPNYLSVYSVSNPTIRKALGDFDDTLSTAELKKRAIHQCVTDAFECYGYNPHHRFGMSDDDPENLKLILEAFHELKKQFPDNAFFAFNTFERKLTKHEVTLDGSVDKNTIHIGQERLFDE